MVRRVTVWAGFALYGAIGLLPVILMVWRSLTPGGRLSAAAFQKVFSTGHEWALLGNSLALAGLTAVACGVIGLPLAVLLARADVALRRVLATLFTSPLVIPPMVLAYGWYLLVGREGVFGGPSRLLASGLLFNLPGCVLVLTGAFTPVVMLLTMVGLRAVNPRLEEAGRVCAPERDVLLRITLPQVLPAVGAALLLVFCMALGEFGTPSFLRFNVFAVESLAQFSAFYDISAATAAAMPLLAVTLIALVALRRLPGEAWAVQAAAGPRRLEQFRLGRWRVWASLAIVAAWVLFAGAPLVMLVLRAASPGALLEAIQRGGQSLIRSLLVAGVCSGLLLPFGLVLGYVRVHGLLGRWVDGVTLFLFALPGPVLGVGLIDLWNRPGTSRFYGSLLVLVLGLIAQLMVLPTALSYATLALVPRSMEEAAAVAGASWWRRFAGVTLPLCHRGLVAAWVVAFLFCLRDTGLSLVLYPPGQDTLPVRLLTLMANGRPELIAALCVLVMLSAALPVVLLGFVLRREAPA